MARRSTLSLSLAALAALTASPPAAAADPVLVFVLAGQSNMVGYGEGKSPELAPDLASQPEVLYDYFNPDVRDPAVGEDYLGTTSTDWGPLEPKGLAKRYGPELTFAKAVRAALPGRQLAIVKVAQGGTNFDEHWSRNPLGEPARGLPPDPELPYKSQLYHALMGSLDSAAYDAPPAPGGNPLLYPNEPTRLDRALARLSQQGLAYELGAVLWMQGENEAGRRLEVASQYQSRLAGFIAAVRQDRKAPALRFVVGRVSDNLYAQNGGPVSADRSTSVDAVRAAQKAVDDADPDVALVDTDDLAAREGDPYHFDSAGYRLLGERFAAAFLAFPPAAGAGGQGGAGGAAGAGPGGAAGAGPGGAAGAGPGAGGTTAGAPPGGGDGGDDDGCSCALAGSKPSLVALAAFAAAGLAALGRRRRARRR